MEPPFEHVDLEVATRKMEIDAIRAELRQHWRPAARGRLRAWAREAVARLARFLGF